MNEIHLKNLDLNLLITFRTLMEERSVVRAADVLTRSPSAVSHALGRLRAQLQDPLLVNVKGRMQPSPRAESLYKEIRPILMQLRQAVQPRATFDPATTTRTFQIAGPALGWIAEISVRVALEAPNARIDWLPPVQTSFDELLNEEIDLSIGPANIPLPDGIAGANTPPQARYVMARWDHPAIDDWGLKAWLRWPHVVVAIPVATRGTVSEVFQINNLTRVIGARIPHWSGIPPILKQSNMLSNMFVGVLSEPNFSDGLAILEPPIPLPYLPIRVSWNKRLENDPAHVWIRQIVLKCFENRSNFIEELLRSHRVIPITAHEDPNHPQHS